MRASVSSPGMQPQHDQDEVEDEVTVGTERQREACGSTPRRAAGSAGSASSVANASTRRAFDVADADERHEARGPEDGEQTGDESTVSERRDARSGALQPHELTALRAGVGHAKIAVKRHVAAVSVRGARRTNRRRCWRRWSPRAADGRWWDTGIVAGPPCVANDPRPAVVAGVPAKESVIESRRHSSVADGSIAT